MKINITETIHNTLDITICNKTRKETFSCQNYEEVLHYIDTFFVFNDTHTITPNVDIYVDTINCVRIESTDRKAELMNEGNNI